MNPFPVPDKLPFVSFLGRSVRLGFNDPLGDPLGVAASVAQLHPLSGYPFWMRLGHEFPFGRRRAGLGPKRATRQRAVAIIGRPLSLVWFLRVFTALRDVAKSEPWSEIPGPAIVRGICTLIGLGLLFLARHVMLGSELKWESFEGRSFSRATPPVERVSVLDETRS